MGRHTLIPRPGFMPRDIDFPEKAERSVKGSLHLAPGVAREVTDDELHHLRVVYPKLMPEIDVISPPAVVQPKHAPRGREPVETSSDEPMPMSDDEPPKPPTKKGAK